MSSLIHTLQRATLAPRARGPPPSFQDYIIDKYAFERMQDMSEEELDNADDLANANARLEDARELLASAACDEDLIRAKCEVDLAMLRVKKLSDLVKNNIYALDYDGFITWNKNCYSELSAEDRTWVDGTCKRISNKSLSLMDEEACCPWEATAIFFDSQKRLVVMHPR